MKKSNRTTLPPEPPPTETGAVLESYARGKNPNSRRSKDPERPKVKITRFVYEDQAHVSGKELRAMIPPKKQDK